jgi:microcystin-dependent protein
MAEPFLGEIRLFAGNFAPMSFQFCHGQTLPIAQYTALYALIGTTYGGDGQNTFNVPDLRGRLPMHYGAGPGITSRGLGENGGDETVTLTTGQIPAHNHAAVAGRGVGHLSEPQGAVPAAHRDFPAYSAASAGTMSLSAVSPAGGSQPHDNMAPFLCINFIIAVEGIFPSQN